MFDVELSVDSFGSHAVVALYGELVWLTLRDSRHT